MIILAIETSCDETAAAIVRDGTEILGSSVASSVAMHEKYGGIVPEVAAREQVKCILPVIKEALQQYKGINASMRQCITADIDAIAVTIGPGLIGSLLVGVETAKTFAFATGKPIIPVNHVLAHMYANFLLSSKENSSRALSEVEGPRDNIGEINFPAISLVVSGGHTELYLMKNKRDVTWLGGTLDDAAGEAFDKTARLLGFGSRGGVAIQESANKYTIHNTQYTIHLPRPMLNKNNALNFSFSGLKTAILREVNKLKASKQFNNETICQMAHEVQESITDVLVKKALLAAGTHHAKSILVSGGVASNLCLREKFMIHNSQFMIHFPPVYLCTDNAAYIASYAFFREKPVNWHEITAISDLSVEDV
jgi:N6-L-threonylcarbamoyladenine synthase